MTNLRNGVLFLFVLLFAVPASAQSTDVLLEFFNATNQVGPVTTFTVPLTAFGCDQAVVPLPSGAIRNPLVVRFTDPARPARECSWNSSTAPATGQGPIFALPIAPDGYVAKATFIVNGVPSDKSDPSNLFFRAPGKPGGVKVGG